MEFTVGIDLGQDADAAELDEATTQLREELLELDVDDVVRPAGEAPPPGMRAVDTAILGTLLVTASQGMIGAVATVLGSWLSRRPERTVKLQLGDDTIELTDVSSEEQRQLLESFLARHREAAT